MALSIASNSSIGAPKSPAMVTMGEGGGSTGVNPRFSSSATTNPALFLNKAAMRV
jgi:hypothetical protein